MGPSPPWNLCRYHHHGLHRSNPLYFTVKWDWIGTGSALHCSTGSHLSFIFVKPTNFTPSNIVLLFNPEWISMACWLCGTRANSRKDASSGLCCHNYAALRTWDTTKTSSALCMTYRMIRFEFCCCFSVHTWDDQHEHLSALFGFLLACVFVMTRMRNGCSVPPARLVYQRSLSADVTRELEGEAVTKLQNKSPTVPLVFGVDKNASFWMQLFSNHCYLFLGTLWEVLSRLEPCIHSNLQNICG